MQIVENIKMNLLVKENFKWLTNCLQMFQTSFQSLEVIGDEKLKTVHGNGTTTLTCTFSCKKYFESKYGYVY